MTRPKVEPDKRQRTAQACDSCKRRKQKCNGIFPCNTCSKRSLPCTYGGSPENASDDPHPSPKRRMVEQASSGLPGSQKSESPLANHAQQAAHWVPVSESAHQIPDGHQNNNISAHAETASSKPMLGFPTELPTADEKQNGKKSALGLEDATGSAFMSRGSTPSGQEEEAVVYSNTRMLQDPTGRLLYLGDSATLSFLQLLRMIIENVAGPSDFTLDPSRHRIVESAISLPANIRQTHLLPDRQTANVLVDAYFTNINGLIEIFDRKTFMTTLNTCYTDPLTVDPDWLCLLHLTFAIGLVMAAPIAGSQEDAIIQKLRAESPDRAELFYSSAKSLADPSAGFEDAGFMSIQALALMSVYMLAVSKRNAAYAYHGMAVRSAFALGLHREETMIIFGPAEQSVRRNLWRSLFVLDRFLAASLGRPTSIRESDCSGTTLQAGEQELPQAELAEAASTAHTSSKTLGLDASVRSCHVVGEILEKVYSKRKISTKIAQDIADNSKGRLKLMDPRLDSRHAPSVNPSQGIAILHVNLLYNHSIILLTRPFFLFLMNKTHLEKTDGKRVERHSTRMEKFGEACVDASSTSINLVQIALKGQYLPRRNPFVMYFLFAAGLVILANEFSALYSNPSGNESISNCINIMDYFAQQDPQGSRLLFILKEFRDVVRRRQAARTQQMLSQSPQGFKQAQPVPVVNDTNDMTGVLSQGSGSIATEKVPISLATEVTMNRHNSNPSSSPPHPLEGLPRPPSHQNSVSASSNSQDTTSSRHNSFDTFYDLARAPSHPNSSTSNDGNDSGSGDAEIDFESLWQWPNSNGTGLTPGLGITPGGTYRIIDPMQSVFGNSMIDVQGVSDSSVPLYGVSTGGFSAAI